MTPKTRRSNSRWLRTFIIGLVLSVACVHTGSAQSPTPTPIDLGTYSIGQVWAQLFGSDTWAVAAGGTLPPGLSLRTDTPPWFSPDAHAGIIGLATTAGDYTFTLTRGLSSPQAYRIRISPLVVQDWWNLKDAFVGARYSHQLAALGNAGPVAWTVDSFTLPPGLTFDTSGLLSGTPTAAGFYNVSFSLTDGTDTVFRSVSVNVFDIAIASPDALADGSLPNATRGAPYHAVITASGGAGGYTFTSDALPFGLGLSGSGEISGTVLDNGSGERTFNVTATDSHHVSYTKRMTIFVQAVSSRLPAINPYGARFDDCALGAPCVTGISATSGTAPFRWFVTGLPPGLEMRFGSDVGVSFVAPGDAEISGTPIALGTFHVQVILKDATDATVTNTFDLRVTPLLTTNYLPNGEVGTVYANTFQVLGGTPPYTGTQIGGRLPLGLTFDRSTLTVSGIPTEAGNFFAAFEFADTSGDLEHTQRITSYFFIGNGTSTLSINSPEQTGDLGSIRAGAFYSTQFFACCSSGTVWSVATGTLPPGLALSPGGVLSGTPPAGTAGTFTFVVRVEDATSPANFAVHLFTIGVTPLSLTFVNLPTGNVGAPYSGSIAVTGGSDVTWTLQPFQSVPPGLALHANGVIDGTPSASGEYGFSLLASDALGHTLRLFFTISIYPAGVAAPLDPSIPPIGLGTYSIGQVFAQLFGSNPWALAAGSSLPPGLSLRTDTPPWFSPDAHAGIIGLATTPGDYMFTLTRGLQSPQVYRIRISPLVVRDWWSLKDAFVGAPYSHQLAALGNTGPVVWTVDSSTLPPGLTLDALGVVSGTPTAAGFYNINFSLTDGTDTVFRSVSVAVFEIAIASPDALADGSLPNATRGAAYHAVITASGGTGGYTFTGGGLPFGLSLSASGEISGTVRDFGLGQRTFNVTATDSQHASYTKRMTIYLQTVPPRLPAMKLYDDVLRDCAVGDPCLIGISATSGAAPFTWSATNLPPGLEMKFGGEIGASFIAPGDAEISGTPIFGRTFHVNVTLTDATGATVTNTFDLRVRPLLAINNFPGGQVGSDYAYTFQVLGGMPPYTGRLVGGRLPLGLTFDRSTLTVSGIPTEAGNFFAIFEFADASGDPTHTQRINIFFFIGSGTSTLIINSPQQTGDLGTISAGAFYSTQFFACCTPTGTVWSVATGTLPPGLALSPGGALSGTPPAGTAGTFTFVVRVDDAASATNFALRQFTIVVSPLSLTFVNLPTGNVGAPYSGSVAATGGTDITWALAPFESLPPGLTLHANGVIDGTPSASAAYEFNLLASDAFGHTLSRFFRITIYPAGVAAPLDPSIPPIGLGTYSIGQVFAQLFGSNPWALAAGSSLPPGLSLRTDTPPWFSPDAHAGIIGLATTPGDYTFTLTRGLQSPQVYRIRISPLVVRDWWNLKDAFVGAFYSHQLVALGNTGPVVWTVDSSTLPPGLTLDALGVLSGTPTAAGFYNVNFSLTDGTDTVFRSVSVNVFDIAIASPDALADGSLPNATRGESYHAMITASGGAGGYTFTGGGLPFGLSLNESGEISGTVLDNGFGQRTFNVTATDSQHASYTKRMSIYLQAVPQRPPAINPYGGRVDDCALGVPCLAGISATSGAAPFRWSATGLPPGLEIRFGREVGASFIAPGDAEVSGTPIVAGTFHVQVTLTDATGATVTNTVDLHVALVLATNYLTNGEVGVDYANKFQVLGGTPPYTGTLVAGRLPLGLTFDPSTLTVSGIPTEAGNFFVVFQFADASGDPEHTQRITNFFFIGSGTSTLIINSPQQTGDLGTITAGTFYSTQFFACCTPTGTVWSVGSGNLPPGLTLSPGGALSGTPPAGTSGTFTFVVRAQDASNGANFALRQFTIAVRTVDTQAPSITITSPTAGPYALNQQVTAVYSCADTSDVQTCTGTVENGASVDTSTRGTHVFTVTATDALGNTGSSRVTYFVQTGAAAVATFHGIGDLAGGATTSTVRDATVSAGVLYAVGAGAAHDQVLCIAPNNPVGCVTAFNTDTPALWTWDGTSTSLVPLPALVSSGPAGPYAFSAGAITRDGAYIASQSQNNAANAAQAQAVRVARSGLVNLDLTAPPFPPRTPTTAALAISDDGSVIYGTVIGRAIRFDVNASLSLCAPPAPSSACFIPLLLPSHSGNEPAMRGASANGSIMVGTSYPGIFTGTNGRAFRYVHGVPSGTVTAIPLLDGGTWSTALAVSPNGNLTLVAGNSTSLPNGELYLHNATAGVITRLGSPNTPWGPLNLLSTTFSPIGPTSTRSTPGGMTADGSVIVVTFAGPGSNSAGYSYVHNAHGWFHLESVLLAQGIDIVSDGWSTGPLQVTGISPDGTLVFGQGGHNGNVEGFVAEFPAGYLAAFDVPAVPPTDTSIVGTWTIGDANNPQSDPALLALMADGTYYFVDGHGFERGRYSWNPVTGAAAFTTVQDTNGSSGTSSVNGFTGLAFTVSGDTLTLSFNGTPGVILTRVTGAPGSIAGGWVIGDPRLDDESAVVALLPDGNYFFAIDAGVDDPNGTEGVEVGTYTWGADGVITATQRVDTNGGLGLSNPARKTVRLSPDELRFTATVGPNAFEFTRIVDPQTVVPVITSPTSATAATGVPFTYTITATHGASFDATGLPAGLSVDRRTGAISGTPTAGGTFSVIVSAINAFGARGSLTVTIDVLAVTVQSPNGGEKVFVNVPTTVRWSFSGHLSTFNVELSRNGGATFVPISECTGLTATPSASQMICAWTPATPASTNARIRVTAITPGRPSVSDASDASFTIANAVPVVTVLAPNTAVSWTIGTAQTIRWSHNLGANSSVRIDLSRNEGMTWESIAASVQNSAATSGTFVWTVNGPATTAALIRVAGVGEPASDINDVTFSIIAPAVTVTAPNTAVTWRSGTVQTIRFTHNLGIGQAFAIDVSRDGGNNWAPLTSVTSTSATTGSFAWTVTAPPTSRARIRVRAARDAATDTSDVDFTITPRVNVTAPNTAVTWGAGSTRTVTWTHNLGPDDTVDIAFSPDAGAMWVPVASAVANDSATTSTWTGRLPSIPTTQGLIRVSWSADPSDADISNVPFTLQRSVITVTAPNTNVAWVVGSTHAIHWTHNLGTQELVRLELTRDDGATWETIAAVVPNGAADSGAYSWMVNGPPTDQARMRVTWIGDDGVQDTSDVSFRIR
jgi:hypothetical protein